MDKPIAQYIRRLRTFGHITDDMADIIAEHCSPDLLPAGTFYVQSGKVSHRIGFIAEGVMRYCNVGEKGDLLTCYFVAENDLAGDPESFLHHTPSKQILEAVTDALVVSTDREQYSRLLARCPALEGISALMVQAFMTSLVNQRAFLLNRDARSRYRHFVEHFPHIHNRAPLGMVASYLGIRQQSLSRLRSQR